MISKKGMDRAILELIIAVVACVVFISITAQGSDLFQSKSKKEQCSTSLISMQQSTIELANIEWKGSTWHPNCPKEIVTISKVDKDDPAESVRRQVAEEIRNCVEKCGNCNIDPFAARIFDAKYYCIICSQISFGKNVKEKVETFSGVIEYMKVTSSPYPPYTYWGYFMNKKYCSEESSFEMFNPEDFKEIDTSKKYVLIYMFDKFSKVQFGRNTIQKVRFIPEEDISKVARVCSETYQ